jgi:hypothetical protein
MIYTCVKYQGKTPLNNQDTTKKMKYREVKQVRRVGTSEGGRANGKGEEE